MNFWHPDVNNAVWITMCLAVAIGINLSGVGKYSRDSSSLLAQFFTAGVYGETEFIFA
jgi:amino acid transporter